MAQLQNLLGTPSGLPGPVKLSHGSTSFFEPAFNFLIPPVLTQAVAAALATVTVRASASE